MKSSESKRNSIVIHLSTVASPTPGCAWSCIQDLVGNFAPGMGIQHLTSLNKVV